MRRTGCNGSPGRARFPVILEAAARLDGLPVPGGDGEAWHCL
jgi:hypothetical protein